MIDVVNLKVDGGISNKFLYITFEASEAYSDIDNYTFSLYRSLNGNSGFSQIASDVKNFSYIDKDVNLQNETVYYYYKVKVVDNTTGEKRYSEIKRQNESEPDRWSSAIESIEEKYISDVIGNPDVYLLSKIKFGAHCPVCYNPNRECADSTSCRVCWGTGVKGGYYPPVKIKINFYNAQGSVMKHSVKDSAPDRSDMQAWTLNFPLIGVNDIIINGDQIFIVTSVTPTLKNGWVIRQVVGLSELPKSNIMYQYEVNNGLS